MEAPSPKPVTRPPRRSGVVVPHAIRWDQRLLAWTIYLSIRAVALTLRYRWEYAPGVLNNPQRPVIFAIWHNRLALSLLMYPHYARTLRQKPRLAAMVSASRDGTMLARILELFGTQPVRGSTSRRGPQALLELTSWAKRGYDLSITPDGPRGPCYTVQTGAIALAQLTRLPVIPAGYDLGWKIRARSWDRFLIPLPFSRVTMRFGEPLFVPREASPEQREAYRVELENRIKQLNES